MKSIKPINILKSLSIITIMLFITACPKPQKYSIIPQLTFKRVELKDSIDKLDNKIKNYRLVFEIIDGDGDIGFINKQDTLGFPADHLYHDNLYINLYEYTNGQLELFLDSIGYRTPFIQPQGQNKNLKADILIDYSFTYINGELKHDSVMFEFFMFDRSLNKSNMESSPILYIDTTGTFTAAN